MIEDIAISHKISTETQKRKPFKMFEFGKLFVDSSIAIYEAILYLVVSIVLSVE